MSREIVCDICKKVMGKPTNGFTVYRQTRTILCWKERKADVCDKCVRVIIKETIDD